MGNPTRTCLSNIGEDMHPSSGGEERCGPVLHPDLRHLVLARSRAVPAYGKGSLGPFALGPPAVTFRPLATSAPATEGRGPDFGNPRPVSETRRTG
jgi:hypothetical protein